MASPAPGNPGRIICFIRDFLVGRCVAASPWMRTTEVCSTRSPAPPRLPNGPAHRLASNYYHIRDLRGGVKPPIVPSLAKLLADNTDKEIEISPLRIPPRPGVGHQWTKHQT